MARSLFVEPNPHNPQQFVSYGPWLPTAYLRWVDGVLHQKFRRRVKHYLPSLTGVGFGAGCGTTYDFEWKQIPKATAGED